MLNCLLVTHSITSVGKHGCFPDLIEPIVVLLYDAFLTS